MRSACMWLNEGSKTEQISLLRNKIGLEWHSKKTWGKFSFSKFPD